VTKQAPGPIVPVPAVVQAGVAAMVAPTRFQIFVDFWNLQITLNDYEAKAIGQGRASFQIDWTKLPSVFVREAVRMVDVKDFAFSGMLVFTSYNPASEPDRSHHKWATTWLHRQPGVHVSCVERKKRGRARCQTCHMEIDRCPQPGCGASLEGTVEKGVDTAIATDMIRLAWEDAYDVAILVTSDADLKPAVEFLGQKGVKVIQAGFPSHGIDLAAACWGSFNLFAKREDFRRRPVIR
jgi:hypothetical protein